MKLGMRVTVGLLAAAMAGSAFAQPINIDLSATGTTGAAPPPSLTYGAAAGQAGVWNNITNGAAANVPLVGLGGGATGATISLDGGGMLNFTNSNPNGIKTPNGSNEEFLMDDIWDPSGTDGVITINGLAAGTYSIYTYGLAPDSITDLTGVTVAGGAPGNVQVGGNAVNPFNGPEDYSVPITHSVHSVTLAGGPLTISIDNAGGAFESINGIQIVPEPATLSLLALAGLALIRRR